MLVGEGAHTTPSCNLAKQRVGPHRHGHGRAGCPRGSAIYGVVDPNPGRAERAVYGRSGVVTLMVLYDISNRDSSLGRDGRLLGLLMKWVNLVGFGCSCLPSFTVSFHIRPMDAMV